MGESNIFQTKILTSLQTVYQPNFHKKNFNASQTKSTIEHIFVEIKSVCPHFPKTNLEFYRKRFFRFFTELFGKKVQKWYFGQNDEKWTLFALRKGENGDFGHFPEGWKALRG